MKKLNTQKDYYLIETDKDIAQVFHYLSTGVVYTDTLGSNVPSHYPIIAFDVETDGLNTRKCKLIGVSLSNQENEGFYFPFKEFSTELQQTFKNHLRSFEQDTNIKLVMHNAVFDIMVIRNTLGIDLLYRLKADTMLMKHLIHEDRPHALKKCAEKYLGIPNVEQQDLKSSVIANGGKFNKTQADIYLADKEILAKYAINDADITLQLFYKLQSFLTKQNLNSFYDREVHPLIHVIINHLSTFGCNCNIDYFKELKVQLVKQVHDLESEIHSILNTKYSKHYYSLEGEILEEAYPLKKTGQFIKELFKASNLDGSLSNKYLEAAYKLYPDHPVLQWKLGIMSDDEFLINAGDIIYETRKKLYLQKNDSKRVINLASTKQLKTLLFKKLGERPIKVTKKDNIQVDNEVLNQFSEKYEWVIKLLELRKLEKLISTYVDAVLDLNEDGVIYPEWLQHGTTSGRFSCKTPNWQTLPREETSIKRGVIARDGYTLINLDYAQLEVRCFAHLSGELVLIDSFHKGEDFYGAMAVDIFNLECEPNQVKEMYPKERQFVKQIGLGLVYGLKKWKLGHILGCSPDDAQILIDKYWETYKELNQFVKNCHMEAYKTETSTTETGRVRHLTGLMSMRNIPERQREFNKLLNLSVNHKVQGLAASIINRATIEIYEQILENNYNAHIILQVHDSLVIEVIKEQAEDVARLAKTIMENIYKLKVPLIVEPKIADNLADI